MVEFQSYVCESKKEKSGPAKIFMYVKHV